MPTLSLSYSWSAAPAMRGRFRNAAKTAAGQGFVGKSRPACQATRHSPYSFKLNIQWYKLKTCTPGVNAGTKPTDVCTLPLNTSTKRGMGYTKAGNNRTHYTDERTPWANRFTTRVKPLPFQANDGTLVHAFNRFVRPLAALVQPAAAVVHRLSCLVAAATAPVQALSGLKPVLAHSTPPFALVAGLAGPFIFITTFILSPIHLKV